MIRKSSNTLGVLLNSNFDRPGFDSASIPELKKWTRSRGISIHGATTYLLQETAIKRDLLGQVVASFKGERPSVGESDHSHHQT